MTIKQTIREFSHKLKEVTHIPAKEVEILILHILNKNVIWLHLNNHLEFKDIKILEKMVKRRATNYPLEYIINKASFYGETFIVKEGVLIPRPETELLVEKADEIIKSSNNKEISILEIGTGSGVISVMLALLNPDIKIIAVDINKKALELAKLNAIKHEVENRIEFIESNLYENVSNNYFDMIISNPPYIKDTYLLPKNVSYEPKNALFGGNIGDEILKEIILKANVTDTKYLLCEMGYDQLEPLKKFISENCSYNGLYFYKDYEKFDRGFILKF